jgi:hypothetical protein
MTYSKLLGQHGWSHINLFESDLNFEEYFIWGHLTNPENRHTKGLTQYLKLNPGLSIDTHSISKLLVSAVFDEHTYSLNMMLGKLMHLPIHWIPLDAKITDWLNVPHKELSGDDLTNEFFKEHNLDITVRKEDRQNVSNDKDLSVQQRIKEYKIMYNENYQKLVKNFLEPDIILYNTVVKKFERKYGSNV